MANVLARLPARACIYAGISVSALCINDNALAEVSSSLSPPQPFEAQYRLEVRGWPGASITHRLSNEGSHWLSDMRFNITIARGHESSRFSLNNDTPHALLYTSSYSLLGVGDTYSLNESEIPSLDRHTALFDLSRRAGHEHCTQNAPCDIGFVDHKGQEEHFQYYVSDPSTITVPAGEFEALNVSLIDVEKPDRLLSLSFHPEWPGLILSAQYQKEGNRETQLTLTSFNPGGGAAP